MPRFDRKTIIVTGAGSGIGEATARRFSEEGANIVLVGRTRDKLDAVAADLPADRTLVHDADVSNADAVAGVVAATLDRFGGIDTLVNNAGIGEMGTVDDLEVEALDKVMATNVRGVFLMSKAVLDSLRRSGGSIVNVSSVSGLGGDWGAAVYDMSKGAVSNFTRAMALDHRGEGVRVNAVAPSLTDTDMAAGIKENETLFERFKRRLPMGRPARPAEVAAVIAFLASEDAAYVNGVNLPVDGGLSAANGQPALNG